MSITSSLYVGASGLGAHGDAITTVGDNISNASTVGFKSSRAAFSDLLGSTAVNGQRSGVGVRMAGTHVQFGQGSLQQTGGAFDMAVRGDGFFIVSGNHDGVDGNWYTRDGQFHLDAEGYLVSRSDLRLQGYSIDNTGALSPTPGDLRIGGQSPPRPTALTEMSVNLDSAATPPALAWDPLNAEQTSNFATSVTVYDSLGADHRVDVYFRNTAPGQWEWHALVDGGDIAGGVAGTPVEIADGTLGFTTTGALDTEAVNVSSASFIGATANQAIAFDFGDAITTDAGTGLGGSTGFDGSSTVNVINQDGFAAGELVDVLVEDDGTLTGLFSNGQSRPVARLALATFASENGLRRAGSQLFAETVDSGQALVGAAATGSRGAVSGGALEQSNVDLGTELVTLIAYQRAFQANARTISTADEMLQEISNLKR